MKRLALIAFLLCLIAPFVSAQQTDTIFLKTKQEIRCYIQFVDDEKEIITYKIIDSDDSPVLSIIYDRVEKIVFRNGLELVYGVGTAREEKEETESFIGLNQDMIKASLTKPVGGSIEVSYEKSVNPRISIQISGGVVVPGLATNSVWGNYITDQQGGYGKISARFYTNMGLIKTTVRRKHPLGGVYVSPQALVTSYSYNRNTYYGGSQLIHATRGAFLLNLGYQWVFSDIFAVDTYFGAGIHMGGGASFDDSRQFSHTAAGRLAVDAGIRLGIAF